MGDIHPLCFLCVTGFGKTSCYLHGTQSIENMFKTILLRNLDVENVPCRPAHNNNGHNRNLCILYKSNSIIQYRLYVGIKIYNNIPLDNEIYNTTGATVNQN